MTTSMSSDRPLSPATDESALKRAFSCFPSGVVAVCRSTDDGTPIGMSASAFTTVSLEPPLVSVCVRNGSATWPSLAGSGTLGVSVFAAHQGEACRRLAGPTEDRFTGVHPIFDESGAVFIPGATAHLACTVFAEVPAGDHVVVLLQIESLRCDPAVEPLVFHASSFRALETRRAND
ncbi:flavin reductase family protein [Gordonia hydrophobica]|uniref:Flavin reductase family protein n=1 Tax=Gordonia hydrophobica TaxID=40516 RepID=A0ABZ2U3D5_9ACTN|nr:flavin reductase family protein [Gordonia hydrophobica]